MTTFKEQVYFQDANGQTRMLLLPDGGIRAGGYGTHGRIFLMPAAATVMDTALKARVRLSGESGDCHLGGNGSGGDLCLYASSAGSTSDASTATIHLRGDDAVLRVGGVGQHGDVWVSRADGKALIQLNGETGDIALENGDCAEEFDMAEGEDVDEGSTMVVTGNGKLCQSERPYDRTVVGVISGAGNLRPGIVLGRKPGRQRAYSLAVAGTVNCKVDASDGPIEVGDLLTTSSRPGYAMKASDVARSFGAVLGKALASLQDGVGLIPMLVALQ